ncbi:MAG: class I SAM-dependent methyltransferase [Magnetospirillum sp.]|nr:class I SAM-dependent methyltransferase [Magnetospirillum sp.]
MSTVCRRRNDCRLCGGRRLTPVLSLAATPPANAFVPAELTGVDQERFPLDVAFCEDCGHVQLMDVVDPRILFEHYVYVSGTSPLFVKHFDDYAGWMVERFGVGANGLAVDIGSNDGTLLQAFQRRGLCVQGIDPAKEIAEAASQAGIPTINGFFGPDLAARIRAEQGPAAVITANNVFAHIDDLASVMEGVRALLAEDGVLAFEVSYLVDVFQNTLFDTIYHEHLDYHSVGPLIPFLAAHGLELIEAIRVPSHGGSIRIVAQPTGGRHAAGRSVAAALAEERRLGLDQAATLKAFGAQIAAVGAELKGVLTAMKAAGKRIAGFGAPAKATTLMYHFGIGPDLVDFIVDDSPLKQGLYSPGMHIPVVPSSAIAGKKPDALVVLAWNFAPSIIEKNAAFRAAGGKFIIPLPRVEVI